MHSQLRSNPDLTPRERFNLGTRTAPFALGSTWCCKFSCFLGKKAYKDITHLYSHALIVTCPQRFTQAVDNSGPSNPKCCARRKGRHLVPVSLPKVLLANVALDERQQPISSPLINELPGFLQETAFLDRLKGIVPGWNVRKLGGSSFANSVGLKADFFGDALLALRKTYMPTSTAPGE